MSSTNAGSGLILKAGLDPRKYPVLEWRWRVSQGVTGVDHRRKSGDDYPIRIYLFFDYDKSGLSWLDRLRYRAYRELKGRYPPHSGLAFVWTWNPVEAETYPNPYTDRLVMRVLRGPSAPIGAWKSERIHILQEYAAYFGEAPPETPLRLAVMTDSNDSGQRTEAALDWIRMRAE